MDLDSMSLTGAATGAAQSLEDIVASRLLRQKLEQAIEERKQQFGLDQQRANETATQNKYDRERTDRLDAEHTAATTAKADQDATARRGRSNMAGVLSMGLDPATVKREIAYSSLNSGASVPNGVMESLDAPKAPGVHVVGGNLVDDSGKVVYAAPVKPERGPQPEYEWVTGANGQPRQIRKGSAQQGDRPYEKPTGTGSSAPNPQEAAATAAEVKRVAGLLKDHKGFNGAFGLVNAQLPTLRQDTADAESLRDALTSLLTLENMGKMKGVLSDSDMKIIRQASTSLNSRMSPESARSELSRVIQVMDRVGGGMPAMNLETSHSGEGGAVDPVDALIAKYGKKP